MEGDRCNCVFVYACVCMSYLGASCSLVQTLECEPHAALRKWVSSLSHDGPFSCLSHIICKTCLSLPFLQAHSNLSHLFILLHLLPFYHHLIRKPLYFYSLIISPVSPLLPGAAFHFNLPRACSTLSLVTTSFRSPFQPLASSPLHLPVPLIFYLHSAPF